MPSDTSHREFLRREFPRREVLRREVLRREVLAVCGTAALAGCSALADSDPDDVVAGVERKSIRATRENRSRPVAENRPTETVEHRAPVALPLETHVADEAVLDAEGIELPSSGALTVGEERAARLADAYDEVTYSLVLTLYERERVVGVPLGNSYGYRISREAFDRVRPGDRVVVNVEERGDLPWIGELVDVTRARGSDSG